MGLFILLCQEGSLLAAQGNKGLVTGQPDGMNDLIIGNISLQKGCTWRKKHLPFRRPTENPSDPSVSISKP